MIDPPLELIIADAPLEMDPVPVLLIKVPGRSYFGMQLSQFDGPVGISFQGQVPAVLRQVRSSVHGSLLLS